MKRVANGESVFSRAVCNGIPATVLRDKGSLPQRSPLPERERAFHIRHVDVISLQGKAELGEREPTDSHLTETYVRVKVVNVSRVGQVRPVDSCGQIEDLDPSLVNSRNLSWVGQVGPVDSCGQVEDLDPSLVNSRNLSWIGQVRLVDSCGHVRNTDPSGSK